MPAIDSGRPSESRKGTTVYHEHGGRKVLVGATKVSLGRITGVHYTTIDRWCSICGFQLSDAGSRIPSVQPEHRLICHWRDALMPAPPLSTTGNWFTHQTHAKMPLRSAREMSRKIPDASNLRGRKSIAIGGTTYICTSKRCGRAPRWRETLRT